jgi:hypothetical protein
MHLSNIATKETEAKKDIVDNRKETRWTRRHKQTANRRHSTNVPFQNMENQQESVSKAGMELRDTLIICLHIHRLNSPNMLSVAFVIPGLGHSLYLVQTESSFTIGY